MGIISPDEGDSDTVSISVVATNGYVLVLTDVAGGSFFVVPGWSSLTPPGVNQCSTLSSDEYHGSSVPPEAYGGLLDDAGAISPAVPILVLGNQWPGANEYVEVLTDVPGLLVSLLFVPD